MKKTKIKWVNVCQFVGSVSTMVWIIMIISAQVQIKLEKCMYMPLALQIALFFGGISMVSFVCVVYLSIKKYISDKQKVKNITD